MEQEELIAGIATAAGQGGVAIVRLSGCGAAEAFSRAFVPIRRKPPFPDHLMMFGHVMDGETVIDEAMGVVMYAPNSYTREDVCEIHTHGGGAAANETLRRLFSLGARPAQPGEFTKRAFLNGRIDLSQAEAVMGVISARGARALRQETAQLEGGSSRFIRDARERLTELMAGLAAHIDYPDEITYDEAAGDLLTGLSALIDTLTRAIDERSARILRDGLRVALCGTPNAGKSTLFNALLGEDRAIVTDVAGTTRDVLTGETQLGGVIVTLMDTAGLRVTSDRVEKIGVDRAKKAIETADAALLVLDAGRALNEDELAFLQSPPDCPCAVLLNKEDERAVLTPHQLESLTSLRPILSLSAKTGQGVPRVREYLTALAAVPDQLALTSERHIAAAQEALCCLVQARDTLVCGQPVDLAGVDMDRALYALGRITGESVDEELLDEVFSRFCVGK